MILKWLKTKFTILTNQNTFILQPEFYFCSFSFFDDGKKAKSLPLAPIAVEILMCRGSAHKIETESGTIFPKIPNLSASKSINPRLFNWPRILQMKRIYTDL
jgi:hypothetical protein